MAEEEKNELLEHRRRDATIGLTEDGEILIMTIPLKKYVDNEPDGAALLYGKFKELQSHATQMFMEQKIRNEKKKIQIAGVKMPNLRVN